jgi:hypothetical protein
MSLPEDAKQCPDCDSHDLTVRSHHRIPGVVHRYGYECDDCENEFRLFSVGWLLDLVVTFF